MLSFHEIVPTEDGRARFVFRTEFRGLLGSFFYTMFGKDIAKESEPNMRKFVQDCRN